MVIQNKIKQKGGGASLIVLTTKLPSIKTTCNNPIGLYHSTESFHHLHSSLDEHLVGLTGFIYSGTLRMGLRGCPETSVRNYHYLLRNNTEECATLLIRAGSLK